MSARNKEVIENVNAAFARNDTEAFLGYCAEEFVWEMVGGERLEGSDAVRTWMASAPPEPPTFSVDGLVAEGHLVVEDQSRVGAVYFMMSEENVRLQMALPWVSFGSDAASMAPEPPFTRSATHPRAYGNFARVLGKYVRDEKVLTMEEAVRKLSGLPSTNLDLDRRGFVRTGMFADVVVFEPGTISDRATFEDPHQYAVGMRHVFVNGVQVLKDGEHTGARPGRALRKKR